MNKGLLNGQKEFVMPSGEYIVIVQVNEETAGIPCSFILEMRKNNSTIWQSKVQDLWLDPGSEQKDSIHIDYKVCYWQKASTFILAGYSKAVFLDVKTGQCLLEVPLEFLGKNSLEVFELIASSNEVVLVSTKRVVVINPSFTVRWVWVPKGFLKRVSNVSSNDILLEEYDTTLPELPVLEQKLSIISGKEIT